MVENIVVVAISTIKRKKNKVLRNIEMHGKILDLRSDASVAGFNFLNSLVYLYGETLDSHSVCHEPLDIKIIAI